MVQGVLYCSMGHNCPVDGCGRQTAFQITVEAPNGSELDIPVCPNHRNA